MKHEHIAWIAAGMGLLFAYYEWASNGGTSGYGNWNGPIGSSGGSSPNL